MKAIQKFFFIMLMSLLLFILVRCDKKDDFDPDSATCSLTSMTFDFSYNHFNSVFQSFETDWLQYDLNGRITEWTTVSGENFTARYEFTYSTEGQFEEIHFTFNDIPFGKHIFTWQGIIATVDFMRLVGETYESDERYVITFNENDEISIVEYFCLSENGKSWTKIWEHHYTWENGNISMIEEYYTSYIETNEIFTSSLNDDTKLFQNRPLRDGRLMFENSIPEPKDLNKIQTITFSYDKKKSPFTSKLPFSLINKESHFASKNNIIKLTVTSHPDNSVSSVSYTYKYNKYNYPTERLFKASGPDWSSLEKKNFEYSCK